MRNRSIYHDGRDDNPKGLKHAADDKCNQLFGSTPPELTCFRSASGIISKRFALRADGKVTSDGSECRMANGTAYRVIIDSAEELARFIERMPSDTALALGRLRKDLPDKVSIVKKAELDNATPSDVIARTADFLYFAKGEPAWMLFDHDRKGMPQAIAKKLKGAGGFWKAVIEAVPGLKNAESVSRRSTSAGLYRKDTGENFHGSANRHVYVAVQDGSDIERALKSLHDRLWLAGYGYWVVGAIGQLLDRSIIDRAVFGPERLVFEGAPSLEPPLAQDDKARQPLFYEGVVIDTKRAIPDLSEKEQKELTALKAEARRRLEPQAAEARTAWAKEFAKKHNLSAEEAERVATMASDKHILAPEFELQFDNLGSCTVADLLANPEQYVNQTLSDPLEGVSYGRCKAKVLQQRNGRLIIHSFAHGGVKYRLGKDEDADGDEDEACSGAPMTKADIEKCLDELAGLDLLDYERQRKQAANKLGVRARVLDLEVGALRELKKAGATAEFMAPVEPWPKPVNGDALIKELWDTIDRHVFLSSDEAVTAVALWILQAHAHDAARHSPILAITSPSPRCGKTTLLGLVKKLVPKALPAANVTPAAIFRAIDRWHPSLLVDEADTFIKGNDELRGILNSGHERSMAYVLRCAGDDSVPVRFSTWAPKAISLIGRLLATLEDRSIGIPMRRRTKSEDVERVPRDENAFVPLLRKCARWAEDNLEGLRAAQPVMPKELHDRACDNWELLFAIADACGSDWPEKARGAAVKLSGVEDEQIYGIQLLRDLRTLFRREGETQNFKSTWITARLREMEDRPWPEFNHSKEITPSGMARLLKPFGITPKQIRVEGEQVQGYQRKQFRSAFERYLPPDTPDNPAKSKLSEGD
jgi:hypothetical protein